MRKIYLDHAATTYIDLSVLRKMGPYLTRIFGNPSSLYALGREARSAIEKSRLEIASILGADSREIIFTGSGTESDNLAIFGVAKAYKDKGSHIIVSRIEHPAVLEATKKMENQGFEVTYLNVDSNGIVDLLELKKSLRKDTILISIIYANNEIGTIQPIAKIAQMISDFRGATSDKRQATSKNRSSLFASRFPLFHTDACQAAESLDLNAKNLGVDLMTINGSKIYGPKGIGCLYASKNIKLEPMIVGGGQENGLRAGTENTALIIGFSEALKLAEKFKNRESKRLVVLRDYFIKNIFKKIKDVKLNGHVSKRLPNNINISISGVEGEAMALMLDKYGIYVSTGSACSSRKLTPSHVLLAIGISPELAHSSLRLTLGRETSKKDLDYVLKILQQIVGKLRKISAIR